jgi:hypothetical protein
VKWPLKLYIGLYGFALTNSFIMWKAHRQFLDNSKHVHFDFLLRLQEQMVTFTPRSLGILILARRGVQLTVEDALDCPGLVCFQLSMAFCL